MEIVNLLNELSAVSDETLLDAFKDGPPIPSNPSLQLNRHALRARGRTLATRLLRLIEAAEHRAPDLLSFNHTQEIR